MKVFPQSIHNQRTDAETWFGVDTEEFLGPAYEKAMDYFNKNRSETLEYYGNEEEIKFMWDMTPEEFKACMQPGKDSEGDDLTDYLGACFFGNYKLEFLWNDVAGAFNNMFWYGKVNTPEHQYAFLEDGTPYEEIDPPFTIPKRRTFEAFAKNVESQVVKWLNDNPIYIEDALVETSPSKWYPDGQCNVKRDITRIA